MTRKKMWGRVLEYIGMGIIMYIEKVPDDTVDWGEARKQRALDFIYYSEGCTRNGTLNAAQENKTV